MSTYEKISIFFQKIRNFLNPKDEWEDAPVYNALIELIDGNPHRFHLRILNDLTGILTIDASFILYLNQTAAIYVQQWISGKSINEIQDFFMEQYRIEKETVVEDFNTIKSSIESLMIQEDVNPVQLGFHDKNAFKTTHEIPLRVYLALTYRYDQSHLPSYTMSLENLEELDIGSHKHIIDLCCQLGVPQITLSGGDPILKKGYEELVTYGEEKGVVMGLMTNGAIFHDKKLSSKVIQDGLDYVIIPLHTSDAKIHEILTGRTDFNQKIQAIRNFEEDDIYLKTKTTLLPQTKDNIEENIEFLTQELKVQNIEVNGLINPSNRKIYKQGIDVNELRSIITNLIKKSEDLGFNFSFTSPTNEVEFNPLDYGLGLTSTHPANTSITIEPDGAVLPVQYYFESPGNILESKWSKIWYSHLFKKIRKHQIKLTANEMDLLTFCGGGIPFKL